MIKNPVAYLGGKHVPRLILSIQPSPSAQAHEIFAVMKDLYALGAVCFDLPTPRHIEALRELKGITDDEALIGFPHLDAEEGASYLGLPLRRVQDRIVATIGKNVCPAHLARVLLPPVSGAGVLTQKEIDRISFDQTRLDKALFLFNPRESPFVFLGERYGDWLLGLGRQDLLGKMVTRIRERGYVPLYSGWWTTYSLPKVKPLEIAGCAVVLNRRDGFFDFAKACDLVKKFDRPVLSLNPLADGKLLETAEEAFSFLFLDLKVSCAVAEVTSARDGEALLETVRKFPSLIPPRKT